MKHKKVPIVSSNLSENPFLGIPEGFHSMSPEAAREVYRIFLPSQSAQIQEATRLIEKAQGGDLSSHARKGGLSDAFKAKLIANGRKVKKP